MIDWETEALPDSGSTTEPNEYYLVKIEKYSPVKAMFIEGEWWTSYITKLMVPVIGWTKLA